MNYDANSKTATQPPQNFLSDKNGFVTADQAYVASLVGFGGIPIAPSDAATDQGTATLVSGAVTVSALSVLATSRIIISLNTAGGTISAAPYVSALTPGTGFTIKAGASDDSVVNFWVCN
jgi:hypothetical protein